MTPDWSKAPEWAVRYRGYWESGSGSLECHYEEPRPVDPYAELKTAAKDPTKQIRFNWGINGWGEWCDSGSWNFDSPPENYQIRDKPMVKTAYRRLWRWTNYEQYGYAIRATEGELAQVTLSTGAVWLGPVESFTYEEPA
jgi:hypothetical protein